MNRQLTTQTHKQNYKQNNTIDAKNDSIRNQFLSQDSKLKTTELLSIGIKRTPTRDEVAGLLSTMISCNDQFFTQYHNLSDAQKYVASFVGKQIVKRDYPIARNDQLYDTSIDDLSDDAERSDPDETIHDLIKKELYTPDANKLLSNANILSNDGNISNNDVTSSNGIQRILGFNDARALAAIVNPRGVARSFPIITLDTRNRILSDQSPNSRTTLSWNFYNNAAVAQGTANGLGNLTNIISIETGTIYLPNELDQLFNEYRQISMLIHEFSDQACVLTNTTRYHFLYDAEVINNDSGTTRLKLTPSFDEAVTVFNYPIASLSTITISFSCPAERITFGYDRYTPANTNVTVSNATAAVITINITHGLSNGDLVYLVDVVSTSAADTAILDIANRARGHVVQAVTATTFELASLDTSAAAGTITCSGIIFGSRRFFIPLKLKYLPAQ